jgi:hypothetical protein
MNIGQRYRALSGENPRAGQGKLLEKFPVYLERKENGKPDRMSTLQENVIE